MPWDLASRIADDYRYFEGVETITHEPKNPPGPSTITAKGHKGAATKERLSLFGGTLSLEDVTCVIEVWEYAQPVNNGDHLVFADGSRYAVLDRFYSPRTSRYECACQEVRGSL